MLPSEFKRLQKQKISERKITPHKKISNTFIENAISSANVNAIKITFYLASVLEKKDIDFSQRLNTLELDTKDLLKYTEITAHEARRTLLQMQKTSISFINEELQEELHINLLPSIHFKWGKNKVEVDLYSKIAKLIVDVKKNYTFINTKTLMGLKNPHSIRLLPILNKISNHSDNVAKRKHYELEDLNAIFGTNYKRLIEIERKILSQVKEELDLNSKLTFLYETQFDNLGKGRPKATRITIDVVDNSGSLFSN